ncbi:MAG TPA: phosphotransferase [Acidimicrobiales bacterium]|nr:phosphotransferase [Acidimicrobiales bacterium]
MTEGIGSDGGATEAPPGTAVWRPEQVTAPWLTDVLRHAGVLGSGAVVSFEGEIVGTGQMADSVRLSPHYETDEPGAPVSLVGKFTPADATSRATAVAMRTSEVEVRFYQEVAPTLRVRTPRCYHADVDPATAEFVLILEDLAPARVGDQVAGCTVDEAALALTELAALHAPRWADRRLETLDWLNRRTAESNDAGEVLLPVLFEGFASRYGDVLEEPVLDVGRRLMADIGTYLRRQPRPWTVQHADYRLDNLLFGGEGGGAPLAVVDWQTVVLGPGVADVSYFLGAGPSVEDRRRHEERLVREYHGALVAGGVTGYPFDDCFADYRRYAYGGYLMAVGASMMVERTARGDEMFLTMARRHAAQIVDLASHELIRAD